jgi:hypothetical protein
LTETGHTLEVRQNGRLVFASDGKWLHPLLDLERFLQAGAFDPASLTLRDKIVGRAAALLIARLRIPAVHAGLISRLGERALASRGVRVTWDRIVDRIECQTEGLLENVDDPEEAHRIVVERARAAAARAARPGGAEVAAAG